MFVITTTTDLDCYSCSNPRVSTPFTLFYNITGEEDYSLVNQAIVFAPGDQQEEVIIDILEDIVTEGTESFQLRILVSSGEHGIILGEPSTVFISDNDGVLLHIRNMYNTI